MGLPLFVVPVEPEAASNTIDEAAAHSRSSIRRRRTIILHRSERPSGESWHVPTDYTGDGLSEQDIAAFRARIVEQRRLLPGTDGTVAQAIQDDLHRRDSGDGPFLNPFSPPVVSSDTPRMPPVPESGDFQSSRNGNHPLTGRMTRRAARPSITRSRNDPRPIPPGYTRRGRPSLGRRQSSRPSPSTATASTERTSLTNPTSLPPLTPNFSPARQHSGDDLWTTYGDVNSESNRRETLSSQARPLRDMPSLSTREGYASSTRDLPPFRQMGTRNFWEGFDSRQRRLRQTRLDGLGDRDRSLSPEGDGTWETLLTTIPPDPQAPSAGSSFASASAAISTSSIGSSATGTSSTTPDSSDIMDPVTDTACDVPDDCSDGDSYSTTDFAEAQETYLMWTNAMEMRNQDRVARRNRLTNSGWMDALGQEENLGGMQRIVQRLAAREDIPDEWWAEVGLSRTLPRVTLSLRDI